MVLGAGWARRAHAKRAGGALGMQAGRWARRRAAGRTGGRRGRAAGRGRRAAGALGVGRWACGLGARAGLGQCIRCTRPIFDPF